MARPEGAPLPPARDGSVYASPQVAARLEGDALPLPTGPFVHDGHLLALEVDEVGRAWLRCRGCGTWLWRIFDQALGRCCDG